MSMLVHHGCGGTIYLDLSGSVSLVATFGITSKGLSVGMGDLVVRERSFTPQFYCPNCKTRVPIEDIDVPCYFCGTLIPVTQAYRGSTFVGMYCREHLDKIEGTPIPFTNIARKATLKSS